MGNTSDTPAANTDLAIAQLCTRLSELRDALREAAANDAAAQDVGARLEAVALRLDRLIEMLATAAGGGPNPVGAGVLAELRAACRDAAGLQLAKDPNALEALVRAVGDAVDRISLPEPAPAGRGRAWGTIKWFNEAKGFGFITPDGGGEDLFAHFSALGMKGFQSLKEGQRVQFDVTTGPKGKQASNIQSSGGHAPRLARADEGTMETLYPDLRPSDLHPLAGAVFTVEVSLSPTEVEGTRGEVHIQREAPDVVRVLKVHLLSDKSSQWDTLEYSISAGTKRAAHFVLTAPAFGEQDHSTLELRANFYLNNRWCGEGVRNLDIRRDAGVTALARIPSPKVPEWRLGLTLEPDATPPDLIVRILKTTHVGEYEWSCLSPHLKLDTPADLVKRTMALGDDAQTYVRNRFQPLAGKSLANIDIADIEGIGQAIYDSTPEVFKDAYWALWSAANEGHFSFNSIQIVTDEPYVPWELMRVYDAKRAPDVDPEFLSVRHCIGRWLAMDAARLTQHISVNATAVAASDYSQVDSIADKLPWAAEEKKLMMDTYRAEEVVLKSDPILKFLKDGRVQALHVACHGRMSITNPLGSQLILEDTPNDLKPTMINRPEVRRGLGSEHPMVFLNACEVGGGAASLTLVAGFPAAFLSAGASAVISPLWVVNDAHAKTIATTFYEQVLRNDSRPLGEVLRGVHSRWRDEKHLTFLAYVLYGDPLATVAYRA